MKNLTYLLFLLFMFGCNNHVDNRANEKIVLDVLNDFIEAIENKDYAKLDQLTHDDFVIYENGSVWDYDRFTQELEEYQDVKIVYQLEDIHTMVDKNTAHVQFYNKGTFVYSDTTIHLQFIESATFLREDNNWTIKFYHSTHSK